MRPGFRSPTLLHIVSAKRSFSRAFSIWRARGGVARLARRELVELTQCVRVSEHWDGGSGGFEHENLPQGGWDDFEQLLYKLGGIDSWPEAGELVGWLTTKVVPRLRWALEGAIPKELDRELTERLAAIAATASKGKRAQNDNTKPAASAA